MRWLFGFLFGAALAQFAYTPLFGYNFSIDGLTGPAITIGANIALAILIVTAARVNWSPKFGPPAFGGLQMGQAR